MIDLESTFPEPTDEMFEQETPTDDILDQEQYVKPDPGFVKKPRRANHAARYESKVKGLLNDIMKLSLQSPKTVPDAAAIIMYGPSLSEKMGDLAADNKWVARGIDFITEGTDNAMIAAVVAAAPLFLQILRNHEPVAEVQHRRFRIPFTKKTFAFRFRVKLGRLRNMTNDPTAFTQWVLGNPDIQAQLAKQDIFFVAPNGKAK